MERDDGISYEYLLDHFGEEKVKERFVFLLKTAKRFLENLGIEQYVVINDNVLEEVVVDYFADIKRLKDFHEIEKTESCKVGAYTAYWIYKRKPLHLKENVDKAVLKELPCLIDVNDWFASTLMVAMVFDTRGRLFRDAEALRLWNEFERRLTYLFTYRIITPQSLELIMLAWMTDPPFERIVKES